MSRIVIAITVIFFLGNTASSQQLAPSIVWAKCLGGTNNDTAKSIIRTYDNGYLVAGASKSNDGDVTGHHGSVTTSDAWLVKLSTDGTVLWKKSYGGTGNDGFNQLITTSDEGYLAIGYTDSNDGDVSGNHGSKDIWVVKLDRNGNILWQKCLGGSNDDQANSIKNTPDHGYILIGNTISNDGQVSGLHNPGWPDVWLVKLDSLGNLQWQRCIGGRLDDLGNDVIVFPNNHYLLGIQTNPSADGDFANVLGNISVEIMMMVDSLGQTILIERGTDKSGIYGLKNLGNGRVMYVSKAESCYPINTASSVPAGYFDTTRSLNGFTGLFNLSSCYSYNSPGSYLGYTINGPDNFIVAPNQLDVIVSASTDDTTMIVNHGQVDGVLAMSSYPNYPTNYTWLKNFGGSGNDYFQAMTSDDDFTFITCGYTNSNNGDVAGNHGGYDFWVVKLGKINNIKGSVFYDYNSNGIKDSNEPLIDNIVVQSQKSNTKASSQTISGVFSNSVDTGTYNTKVLTPLDYYNVVPASANSTFATYNNKDSLAFALQPIPGKRDYTITVAGSTARPGRILTLYLQYKNNGTDTLQNRQIKLIKDHRISFQSATPAQTSASADTIIWTIASLLPRQSGYISVDFNVPIPPAINLTDTIMTTVMFDTTGDIQQLNNTSVSKVKVSSSFDPNGKTENHIGTLNKDDQAAGAYLIYTIYFQNTGNDTAFNVILKDTLDSRLDSSTIEVVSASHPYKFTIQNGIYCTWTFNNILLPDSIQNERASHGYVTYRIKPKANLNVGDSIKNTASIYFDFNLPVPTNRQVTVLAPASTLSTPTFNGLLASYCSNQGVQKGKITNLPSNGSGVTVSVKVDNNTLTVAADSSFNVDLSTLSAGSHSITVTYSNSSGNKAAAFNFNVTATVTPDVNATANITNVTNLSNPVIVTATNASGGGTTPLYTFAKDKAFSNILKAESSSDTLHITPTNLIIGDNWIYVRMKTSATCYTAQTNIDSIDIRRDQSTGIVDLDDPSRVINIYPNPFRDRFTIDGLNASKTYTVEIYNLQGQLILQQKVTNKSTIQVPGLKPSSSVYWLSIFDDRKQRLIGSVKLLKQ